MQAAPSPKVLLLQAGCREDTARGQGQLVLDERVKDQVEVALNLNFSLNTFH